jgi:hypothetical protein
LKRFIEILGFFSRDFVNIVRPDQPLGLHLAFASGSITFPPVSFGFRARFMAKQDHYP